jgi:hypothetical protein
VFGESGTAVPDGLPGPDGSESVWQRLARELGSAGFVPLPPASTRAGVVPAPPGTATPRRAGRPSVGPMLGWPRQEGVPPEFVDRLARILRGAYGWDITP